MVTSQTSHYGAFREEDDPNYLGTIHILRKHLEEGGGVSENGNFCLFSVLLTYRKTSEI